MISESKEELVQQLTTTWEKLMEVDRVLEEAADAIAELHKDVRTMIRQHDKQTTVRGADGVGASTGMAARSDVEANAVHRVSDAPRKYPLRPR